MADQTVVIDMPAAQLLKHWNELTLAEKQSAHDPTKLRIVGWVPDSMNGYMGAFSANVAAGSDDNLIQYEKILIGFKIDPDPCIDIYMQRTRHTTEDRDMVHVMRLSVAGLELKVPLVTGTTGSSRVTRFYTDGGKFMINWQDDTGQPVGVVYSTNNGSADETTWKAVGTVQINPL